MKAGDETPDNAGDDVAYLTHADKQAAAAATAWKVIVAGLSEEQRRKYEEMGLIEAKPKKEAKKSHWKRAAPSEERACFRELRLPKAQQTDEVVMSRQENKEAAPLVATRFILAALIDAERPRLEASIIAAALEIGELQGITPKSIARHYSVELGDVQQRVGEWQEQLCVAQLDCTLPKYVVSHVLEDSRPRLQADCFAMAFDFPLRQGMSERQLAKCYGLTVAALSARVIWWVKELNARLPGVCKKHTAAYKDSNVQRQPDNPFSRKP